MKKHSINSLLSKSNKYEKVANYNLDKIATLGIGARVGLALFQFLGSQVSHLVQDKLASTKALEEAINNTVNQLNDLDSILNEDFIKKLKYSWKTILSAGLAGAGTGLGVGALTGGTIGNVPGFAAGAIIGGVAGLGVGGYEVYNMLDELIKYKAPLNSFKEQLLELNSSYKELSKIASQLGMGPTTANKEFNLKKISQKLNDEGSAFTSETTSNIKDTEDAFNKLKSAIEKCYAIIGSVQPQASVIAHDLDKIRGAIVKVIEQISPILNSNLVSTQLAISKLIPELTRASLEMQEILKAVSSKESKISTTTSTKSESLPEGVPDFLSADLKWG